MSSEDDLNELLKEALNDALRDYFADLFRVWMVEETGQPQRAQEGAFKAIAGYKNALTLRDQKFDGDVIRRLLREALDQSFRLYIMKLFSIWMHDGGRLPVPPATMTKRGRSMRGYLNARKTIDELIL